MTVNRPKAAIVTVRLPDGTVVEGIPTADFASLVAQLVATDTNLSEFQGDTTSITEAATVLFRQLFDEELSRDANGGLTGRTKTNTATGEVVTVVNTLDVNGAAEKVTATDALGRVRERAITRDELGQILSISASTVGYV